MKSLFISISIFSFILVACEHNTSDSTEVEDVPVVYFTGAERVKDSFLTDSSFNAFFSGGDFRSDAFALEGKYSLRVDSVNKYSMAKDIDDPIKGEFYLVSIWKKSDNVEGKVFCSMKGSGARDVVGKFSGKEKNKWQELIMNFVVGEGIDRLRFYVTGGGKEVYFDNFTIKRYAPDYLEKHIKGEALNLIIPLESQKKLNGFIETGLKELLISKKLKEYVPAFIIENNDTIPVKIRLKGDWPDHLRSGKVSYRIKVEGNKLFRGQKTFSIQHPATRNYMDEWLMHAILQRNNLLATAYDFIPVRINGVLHGVYAMEQHFDDVLLEQNNRQNGPILKFNEDGFWEAELVTNSDKKKNQFPFFDASYVDVFRKKYWLKNNKRKKLLQAGANLMSLLKRGDSNPNLIFNVEDIAHTYALIDFGAVRHGLHWHNRRYYYNSESNKLEMIGYDWAPGEYLNRDLYVYEMLTTKKIATKEALDFPLLWDSNFREAYHKYLSVYADTLYVNQVFANMDSAIVFKEKMLQVEVPDYTFNREFYLNRAIVLKNKMEELDYVWNQFLTVNKDLTTIVYPNKYTPFQDSSFALGVSLNAYQLALENNQFSVELFNFHPNDLSVLGFVDSVGEFIPLEKPLNLKGFDGVTVYSEAISLKVKIAAVRFTVENVPNKTFTKKVIPWAKPGSN